MMRQRKKKCSGTTSVVAKVEFLQIPHELRLSISNGFCTFGLKMKSNLRLHKKSQGKELQLLIQWPKVILATGNKEISAFNFFQTIVTQWIGGNASRISVHSNVFFRSSFTNIWKNIKMKLQANLPSDMETWQTENIGYILFDAVHP